MLWVLMAKVNVKSVVKGVENVCRTGEPSSLIRCDGMGLGAGCDG
jgi:hypothetical protein